MRYIKYVFIILISLFSIMIIVSKPKIILTGKDEVTLKLGEKYKEQGYYANYIIKNLSKNVTTMNNIDNKKIGEYQVKYVLNYNNKKYKKIRKVNVIDDISPKITLTGDGYYCAGKEYVEEGYKAEDNYDGELTNKVKIKKEKEKVIYTVKDSSKNEITVERNLKEKDVEEPNISLNSGEEITIYLNSIFEDPGYQTSDNCDDSVEVHVNGSVDTSKLGEYQLDYEAIDKSGNKKNISRKIKVVERVYSGTGKNIYLTFDDGPSNSITPSLLNILKEEDVKATFFVINHDDSLNYLIKREHDEGHKVSLHSFTHNYQYIYQSPENYFNDLYKIREKVHSITGEYSNIIRFPGGSSNTISRRYYTGIMSYLTKEVEKKGFHYFDWNISSGDAGGSNSSSDVYNSVTNNLKYNNNIVLMHDFEGNYMTLNAIRDIIKYGKENGYTFKTIDESTFPSHHGINN